MNLHILTKGILIGILIAAPVGPIGFLCIKRTLCSGRVYGFVAGLGAATADTIYGAIAGLGLKAVSSMLIHYRHWFGLFSGIFLCCVGVISFFARPDIHQKSIKGKSLLSVYFSTFLLTLANPLTILSFTAIFTGLGVGHAMVGPQHRSDGWLMNLLVLGVFIGSVMWWLFLSILIGGFRSKFDYRKLLWVNRISGIVITGFGIFILYYI
jgi:threonine/homoserine/homoserine lactone efflux protein